MAGVKSNVDLFAQGTPKFDTVRLCEYVRASPTNTDPSYGLGGTGYSLNVWTLAAILYSGWFGQLGSTTPLIVGQSATPAVSSSNSSLGTRVPVLWLPRDLSYTDADVEMCYQEQSTNPALLKTSTGARRTFCGVAARVAGATLTNAGLATTYHANGDGYFFGWLFDNSAFPSGGGKFVLFRVNAGVVTRLADSPTGGSTSMSWVAAQPWKPHRLRMTVHDSGGATVITCYQKKAGLGSVGSSDVIFTYTDSSGSRLTAAGRVGFFASCEESSAAVWSAPCVNYFSARAYGSSTFDLVDDWSRYNLGAATLYPQSSAIAFAGRDLRSGWLGDSLSAEANHTMREDDGNDRAKVQPGTDGVFTRQRPASDPVLQERKVVVRFSSSGTGGGTRAAGPAVRVSHPAGFGLAPQAAYDLVLEMDDVGAAAKARVYRTQGFVRQLLAECATTYSQDTDVLLALKVDNASTGWVRLYAFRGGVQLALALPASPLAGIFVDSAGTVTDSTSLRVVSGPAEGIRATVPVAYGRALYVDSWDVGAGASGVPDESDQASVTMPDEAAGVTGTLALPESWPISETSEALAVQHELDLGQKYASTVDATIGRTWQGSVSAATQAELDAFLAFVTAHRYSEVPFYWTPYGDIAPIVARFGPVDLRFEVAQNGPRVYRGTFQLEEIPT